MYTLTSPNKKAELDRNMYMPAYVNKNDRYYSWVGFAPSGLKDYEVRILYTHSRHPNALPQWMDFPEVSARTKQEAIKRSKRIVKAHPVYAIEILQIMVNGQEVKTNTKLTKAA